MRKKLSLILAIFFIAATFGCVLPGVAFAAEEEIDVTLYTDVIDDLQRDESFSIEKYPTKADHKLEVIQVAESSDGELFVYVYQHTVDSYSKATSIRFSTSLGENFNPKDYELLLLNETGTLAKYLVLDFEVKQDVVRYYDIVAIHRKWVKGEDDDGFGGNTVDEVALEVGKLFTAITYQGEVSYTEEHSDVIVLKNYYTGNIAYESGLFIGGLLVTWLGASQSSCNSHYVAFSTDLQIDQIEEAVVTFVRQDWTYSDWIWNVALNGGIDESQYVWGDRVPDKVKVEPSKAEISTGGVLSRKYTWDRIQSSLDFVNDVNVNGQLSKDKQKDILKTQWVLRFYETELNVNANLVKPFASGTKVSDVTILQLKFITNGKTYNLGVVANKQTGHGHDNVTPTDKFLESWERFVESWNAFWGKIGEFFANVGDWCLENWKWLLIGAVGIVVISLYIFVRPIRFGINWIFKWTFKILWYIISFLPRLMVLIIEKIGERRQVKK